MRRFQRAEQNWPRNLPRDEHATAQRPRIERRRRGGAIASGKTAMLSGQARGTPVVKNYVQGYFSRLQFRVATEYESGKTEYCR